MQKSEKAGKRLTKPRQPSSFGHAFFHFHLLHLTGNKVHLDALQQNSYFERGKEKGGVTSRSRRLAPRLRPDLL